MSFEQEQSFYIEKASLLKYNVLDSTSDSISEIVVQKSTPQLAISDIFSYGFKNVKIELPRVNIPNEVIGKHEIDRYIKLFRCKEKPATVFFKKEDTNDSYPNCSEVFALQSKAEQHHEEELKTSAKILNFSCTKCRSNIRYSPNDLQKHFQLLHHGELPSYPCEMCDFSANDFQSFNQHRRTHRSTLVKCEICNDEHRYTLLDLTKHFTSRHCVNGHFQCARCSFSTLDVGTFVQHIHKHNEIKCKCDKCQHISFSKEEFQKHVVSHSGTFPFSCQYCNYMASRKTYLLKHIIALHRDHLYAKDNMDTGSGEKKMETSAGLKLILKRYKTGASRKALWRRKRISSGSCGIEDAQIVGDANNIDSKSEEINPSAKDLQLNEEHVFLREKHIHSGTKSPTALQYSRAEDGLCSGRGLLKKAVRGPTVMMVKNNKISVPANYSAKFMGFKMVDGKQHIVIKLLPKPKLPAVDKIDGVKDISAECLQHDNHSLLSGAGPHEGNQQMSTNNSVPSLTSALSNPYSRKIKQESNSCYDWNTSQSVVPPVVVTGKRATLFPLKPDTAILDSGSVSQTGMKDNISWRNSIPQDHPQVLPSAGTNMLRQCPMKRTFSSEFKLLNSEVNRNNKHDNVYYPTDGSNQTTLPFHNYSKIGILDTSKELLSSKTFPVQSSLLGETTTCFPQSAAELNLEKRSSVPPVYGNVNTYNAPVFSTSRSKYATDGQCCTENHHDGKQYLNTRVNQVLERIAENSKHDNASNCINSCMPKITSVFSLQSNQAFNYLSREVNQSLQDVLKVKPTNQPQKYIKTDYDQSFSNSSDYKTVLPFKDQTAMTSLVHSPDTFRRELNVNCNATKESVNFWNERRVPITSLRTQETQSTPRTAGIGALRKTQTDAIITQQLAKDKLHYTIQGSNATYPSLSEQKKAVLLQSSSSRYFVPLRLAHQQGLQVITGKPSPSKSSSDTQATRPTSLLLNKGPGMILTFGSGPLGAIANATENNSQVLDKFLSKECAKEASSTSQLELKKGSSRSVQNSFSVSACSGAGSSSSIHLPHKEPLNITNSGVCHDSGISSVKILTGYQGSKVDSLESRKQQEIGQEQPVYALLPNGRQAVFLKCMSPNKTLVQNHNVFQGTACTQNTEPKKSGAMQQKLFWKIKTFPATENCQPVSNAVSSLQFNNMHSLNSPALEQKRTAFSSSDALILPGILMPENACLSSCKSKDPFTSVESVHSSKPVKTRSQKCPSDPAQKITNKGSSFGSQLSTGTMTNKISKPKQHSKQANVKVSNIASQKNRNLKRKAKDDLQEYPRKKMLHRKCKEKNQMDISELESLIQAPRTQKVSKDTVRILKLLPFNSKQLIKCPRRNQPVVVLNHPDADVPEVENVMKTIAKFKGHVLKVSLSKRTIDALLEPAYCSNSLYIITDDLPQKKRRLLKPVSPVKERFVLKLTLKKTSKNNYQIVKTTSDNTLKTKFRCWFCGRIFDNQDKWVGHGQRHLMEATRDWNSLG